MTRIASATAPTHREYDVAVLGKALELLEALGRDGDLGLSELVTRSNVSKASAFRVLATLQHRGYVAKNPSSRKYAPGPRLVALSSAVLGNLNLVRATQSVLESMYAEFGETVNLGALVDDRVVYLNMLESRHGLRTAAHVGTRDDLHSTALGKAILAHLPAVELEHMIRQPLTRKTIRTIVDRSALLQELETTRARGYAVDDEENEIGSRCVAVALLNHARRPVGAVSVSGPVGRISDEMVSAIGSRLVAASTDLEIGPGAGTHALLPPAPRRVVSMRGDSRTQ